MFNLQSGIQRQRFPPPLTPMQAKKLESVYHSRASENESKRYALGEGKHKKAISGIMVDTLNRTVISCSLDGKIKFWDFQTGCLLEEIDWHPMAAIIGSQYHRPNDLVALSCNDLSIRIVDTETKKLVRELWGCLGQIGSFCFSNDGRWIIAASMDSIVRVWDLPTGNLINAIRMESPCTALAFSETGEYLATAHADSVGINLWNNRTLFTHVPTKLIQEDEIIDAIRPTSSGENSQSLIAAAFSDEGEDEDTDDVADILPSTTDQISSDLVTLSLVPRSRWQTLLHLDTITQRNKPTEPPKRPEKAPFFLPSTLTSLPAPPPLAPQSSTPSANDPILSAERSRTSKLQSLAPSSNSFTTLLHTSHPPNYDPLIAHLASLSPPAADLEIRSLTPSDLVPFITALTARLLQKKDFELVQTWMAVFLRVHTDSVVQDAGEEGGLREALGRWREVQSEVKGELSGRVAFCKGVLGWLRSER